MEKINNITDIEKSQQTEEFNHYFDRIPTAGAEIGVCESALRRLQKGDLKRDKHVFDKVNIYLKKKNKRSVKLRELKTIGKNKRLVNPMGLKP